MKCVKKNSIIKRVKDSLANLMCGTKGWKYCPKSEWKKVRDAK